jgi:hypothetical protein
MFVSYIQHGMSVADANVPGASDVWTKCYAYSVTPFTNVCAIPVACGKIYFSDTVNQSWRLFSYVVL